jgi:hypothetical protein
MIATINSRGVGNFVQVFQYATNLKNIPRDLAGKQRCSERANSAYL